MKTSPHVSFGLYATGIKQDAAFFPPTSLQPFSKVDDLRTDSATNTPYATYEPDFWRLDGTYKFLPDDIVHVHIGVMTQDMSRSDGTFAAAPSVGVEFTYPHDITGITLRFSEATNDYASNINITYYDSTMSEIRVDHYTPTSWEFSTGLTVVGVKLIIIDFFATNKPYRYLRLKGIDFGSLTTWDKTAIKTISVVEETDPLSVTLPIGTMDLHLHSTSVDFSILDPAGDYATLNLRQPLSVYETVGNESVFIGQYYLEKWSNPTDTEVEFECMDLLGVLDKLPFMGGIWLGVGIAVEDLLALVLTANNVPFDLDSTLYGTMVIGWIPICACREALQQIAFSIGAYVDCSRDRPIKIYSTKIAVLLSCDATITKAAIGIGSGLTLRPMVTGVEVTAHNLVAGTGTRELYNGILDNTELHKVTFDQPMYGLTITGTGASISSSGANYAIIAVSGSPVTVVLTGYVYENTEKIHSVYMGGLDPAILPNILKVTNATLVNSANADTVAQLVYDYYQQRYTQSFRLYAPSVAPNDVILIDTLYSKKLLAGIEKMSIDLSGGMIADCDATGGESV